MAMLPTTVGELRRYLETYPDDLAVFVQNDTVSDPNATPVHFVVEYWEAPETDPPLLLLAAITPSFENLSDEDKRFAADGWLEHENG